jgi:response regulator RpfG family c-di-GMP phosphodiesterase
MNRRQVEFQAVVRGIASRGEGQSMTERILIVHGDGGVRRMLAEAATDAGHPCDLVADEPGALRLLRTERFGLALLDLDRPHLDGLRFLQRLHECYPEVALLAVTAGTSPSLVREALRLGAAEYLTLPVDPLQFGLRLHTALERKRRARADHEYQRHLEQLAAAQTQELQHTYREVLSVLGAALDTRDPETGDHSQRVIDWTIQVAREMGLRGAALRDIEWGAALHDVGKIGIPDSVLLKPGKLTAEEWAIMKSHCEIGYRMLCGFEFLRGALPIVLHHHERYDGAGYPTGLRADAIPFGARIFGVADAYDAMTSDRPYRRALPHEEAVAELRRCARSQFDPEVVEAFMDTVAVRRRNETRSGAMAVAG